MSDRGREPRSVIDDPSDAAWGRPLTPAGADLLVRWWGWRFAGFVDPAVSGRDFAALAGRSSEAARPHERPVTS